MIAAILAAGAIAQPQPIERLAWMAGAWREERGGTVTREVWLSPVGGAMSDATQTNRPGAPARQEFETITTQADGRVVYTRVIQGVAPTPFALKPGPDGEAVFERVSDDFPKRVIYPPLRRRPVRPHRRRRGRPTAGQRVAVHAGRAVTRLRVC